MMKLTKLLVVSFALCAPAMAVTYHVNAATGSNSNTCLQAQTSSTPKDTIAHGIACMGTADTVLVHAGTYSESNTIPAGAGSGSYNIVQANGSDVVNVTGSFAMNSHTKLVGNCANPNYPTSVPSLGSCGFSISGVTALTAPCVTFTDQSTDVFILSNVMKSCGSGGSATIINGLTANGLTFVTIQGNTMSYGCGTAASPDNCTALYTSGNHWLVQNNDMSHLGLAIQSYGQFIVIRNNSFHDMNESECGAQSGNCHLDIIFSERSNTSAPYLVQYHLWEGNIGNTITGADGKGLWTAADNPGGCGTSCFNVIGRFNVLAHFGSTVMAQTSGFENVKYYNNDVIDAGASAHGSPATIGGYLDDTSPGGAIINNLYYSPVSIASNWGWYGYSLNSSGDATGFTAGTNLLFCASSPCALQTLRNGTSAFAWTSDTPVISSNISTGTDPLVNYSTGDFHLTSGSAAARAGVRLTTVGPTDTGTGTSLIVADAGFFQDGLGLTGVNADCISVTTVSNHLCVTAVNYTTKTLTLASSISRSSGDPVWLYSKSDGTVVLTGSAPDIGALPLTVSGASTCTPGTGTYTATQTPACTNPNSGTTVQCYTLNGSTPATNGLGTGCTTGTSLASGGTVTISVNETLEIIAGTSTLPDSPVNSYTYTLQGGAPSCSPGGGTYSSTQSVTLTSPQSQSMCYTLNGSTPTSNGSGACSNGTLYSTAIAISITETLEAIGMASGWTDSSVMSCAYTINAMGVNSTTMSGSTTISGGTIIK